VASSDHPKPDEADAGLVLVHVANTSFEAYALRARLEAEDIPVFVKGESEGPYRMAYTAVRLYVPERVEVQARMLIAEAQSGEWTLPDEG
jgi:hypothetical protein